MKIIVIPVETCSRELAYKYEIAKWVKESFTPATVILCRPWVAQKLAIIFKNIVWIGQNIFENGKLFPRRVIHYLKQNNSQIIYIDEEGGVYPKEMADEIFKKRYQAEEYALCDVIFTWGTRQAKILAERGIHSECVGHPRFAIFKDKQRKKGDHIIIMTNFSLFTSALSFRDRYFDNTIYEDRLWSQTQDFAKLLKKIHEIGPSKKVIIRPHPSEDINIYRQLFKHLGNIEIQENVELEEALKDASKHFHFDCTTALTALANGVPTHNLGKSPSTIISDIIGDEIKSAWLKMPFDEKTFQEKIFGQIQKVSSTKTHAQLAIIFAYLLEFVYRMKEIFVNETYHKRKFGNFYLSKSFWKLKIC